MSGGLIARLRAAPELILFLDYDGTLVPFASRPEFAAPDAALLALLGALASRKNTSVNVVSGRDAPTLEAWLGALPIGLHGEHGLWWRDALPGSAWRPFAEVQTSWKETLRPLLEQFAAVTPGALVEEKPAALAWHYRAALDPDEARENAARLALRLREAAVGAPFALLEGNCVLELRARGATKGDVVLGRCSELDGRACAAAFGDDLTDEDMFAVLPPGGLSVHVGPRESRATYRLAGPEECRRVLGALSS